MPAEERIVAGLSCSDVLARLSDFLDGEVEAETRARILEHIAGCHWCDEFGGRFGAIVTALREAPDALEEGVARRLAERLAREGQ